MPSSKESHLHQGHRQRTKNRFLQEGLDHFEPHTALELALYYSIPVQDTNELAHKLIRQFGSFSGVLNADFSELCKVSGVGEHVATFLKLIPALARYYLVDLEQKPVIFESVEQIAGFIQPQFVGKTKELVYLLALGNKGQPVFSGFVFEGSINSVAVYAREIAEIVVRTQAVSVVLSHNHPGGIAIPSTHDMISTKTIQESLDALHVQLLDHLIFAGGDYVSMRSSHFF